MNILLIAILSVVVIILFVNNFTDSAKHAISYLDSHSGAVMAILTFFLVLGIIPTLQMAITASEQLRIQQQPIILRDGIISEKWDDFFKNASAASPFAFAVGKNYAMEIEGVVIYGGKEYPLIFALGIRNKDDANKYSFNFGVSPQKMGWTSPGSMLGVYPDQNNGKPTNLNNMLRIKYKDVGGVFYCTTEDDHFSSKISKCSP
ncbi:MAG: hypothetical protein Q8P97_01320 [bacterium]|nr:hypothetical protein [bacterium]